MPKIKTVSMTPAQRTALEKSAKYGSTPSFRLRCQAILLKCESRTSLSVAQELGCCEISVNDWMKRFCDQGMDGLKVAKGRGRKGILEQHGDLEAVRRAVAGNRQRISLAKAELEKELGKEFSQLTLRRFLKKTVDASNELGG
jgi:transposase